MGRVVAIGEPELMAGFALRGRHRDPRGGPAGGEGRLAGTARGGGHGVAQPPRGGRAAGSPRPRSRPSCGDSAVIHAVRIPSRRLPHAGGHGAPAGLGSDLSPVAEALAQSARSRSEVLLSDARREAFNDLEEARAEAERILNEARIEGEASASRSAAIMSARTSRQAHEEVLAARRIALETLRRRATESLEQKLTTSGGVILVDVLQTIANARVGLAPPPPGVGNHSVATGVISAERANRRATASLEDLVDSVLNLLAPKVESLWA